MLTFVPKTNILAFLNIHKLQKQKCFITIGPWCTGVLTPKDEDEPVGGLRHARLTPGHVVGHGVVFPGVRRRVKIFCRETVFFRRH